MYKIIYHSVVYMHYIHYICYVMNVNAYIKHTYMYRNLWKWEHPKDWIKYTIFRKYKGNKVRIKMIMLVENEIQKTILETQIRKWYCDSLNLLLYESSHTVSENKVYLCFQRYTSKYIYFKDIFKVYQSISCSAS